MELRNSGNELLGERLTRKNVKRNAQVETSVSGMQKGNRKEIS
jgi:hypothetical protein